MRRNWGLRALVGLVVIGCAVAGESPPGLAASRDPLHEGSGSAGRLYAVDALSSTDVWAVGYTGPDISNQTVLIEHWDGIGWRRVPAPHPRHSGALLSVSAVSADDVWASGYSGNHVGGHPLVMHWDGETWTQSPFDRQESAIADGISADAPDDVWVVGGDVFGGDSSFLEHWDGSAWTRATNPNGATLRGVSAVSPTDAWAAGYLQRAHRKELTVALHWDGASWSVVPTVDPHFRVNVASAVSALPSGPAWEVGHWGSSHALIEQWDGTTWTEAAAPNPYDAELHAVSAEATDDVWAVGKQGSAAPTNLIGHWDGKKWSKIAAPKPGDESELWGVSADSSTDAWAVGTWHALGQPADDYTWIEHWDGHHWTKA